MDSVENNKYDVLVKKLVSEIRELKNVYFKGDKLIANNLAGDIVFDKFNPVSCSGVNRGFFVLDTKDKDIYVYFDGVYLCCGEDIIRGVARVLMGDKSTNQRVLEVIGAVKSFTSLYVNVDRLNNYPFLINLKNGVYNLETGELLPHDKKFLFTTRINVSFDAEADCKLFKKFISEIHVPEQIPLVQELFGYCLYPSYEFNKIFFCIGTGRNGKSTEQRVLTALVGPENVSNVSIKQLISNPFTSAMLHNKLVNLSGEVGDAKVFDTEVIKALSGEDYVTAQHKHKQLFTFKNFAKLVFAVNKAPEITDDTTALWNRMIIIDYPNVFLDTNPKTDPDLKDKLTTPEELSGIFNWAIEGLKRLRKNGQFTYSRNYEVTKSHYDKLRNHVIEMVEEKGLVYMIDNFILKSVLYKMYKDWCMTHVPIIQPYDPVTFSKKLFEAVLGCTSDKVQVNNKRVPVYMDIGFKDFKKNLEVFNEQFKAFDESDSVEDNQQKLDVNISLSDKINSLKVFLEDNPVTVDELVENGFDESFIDNCIKQCVIIKRPDGRCVLNV